MHSHVGNAYVYYQSIDPEKVAVVQALCDALMAFPSLRLGQLICNARGSYEDTKGYDDEFYIPDAEMVKALKNYERLGRPFLDSIKEKNDE